MLNNEKQKIIVRTYNTGTDSYGQLRQLGYSDRESEMMIKIYSQSNVADPRYVDVTDVGLTLDKSITVNDEIVVVDNISYHILYIYPTRRYNQILMRRK